MSRYDALTEKLQSYTEPTVILTFDELDEIVGDLPASAKTYGAWWANKRTSQPHAKAWLDAGRRAKPDFKARLVVFTSEATDEPRYWIFQPTRSDYHLPSAIAKKQVGEEDEWPVVRNVGDMHPGDRVLFYQMRVDQGVYAAGELVSEPYADRQLEGEFAGDGGPAEKIVRVRYTHILREPFTREVMNAVPTLRKMHMMRSSDCINCVVTPEEWAELLRLVEQSSRPRFWWVNQGPTYEKARDGGYISAPQATADGRALPYWTSLTSVRTGDLVINYARKAVRGVSVVVETAAESPVDNSDGEQVPGWLVRLNVHELAEPIDLDEIPEEWRSDAMEGGPFDYRGQVNMGYLYPLSDSFAQRFFSRFADRLPEGVRPMAASMSTSPDDSMKVLKVAPGRDARYWQECLEGGFICVGWEKVPDLRNFDSEVELRQANLDTGSTNHPGTATIFGRVLWAYRNLEPGDLIVANKGQSEVLAIGEVTGPYEYRGDREYYPHVVPVRWDTTASGPIPDQGTRWRHTIWELSPDDLDSLRAALGAGPGPGGESTPPSRTPFDQLMGAIRARGLYFSAALVSNYLLALQTKRFCILTGISGTGKTQLALAVAQHLQSSGVQSHSLRLSPNAVEKRVEPSYLEQGMVVPQKLVAQMQLPENAKQERVPIPVLYPGGETTLGIKADPHPDRRQVDVGFTGEFMRWFRENCNVGDPFWLDLLPGDPGESDGLVFHFGGMQSQPRDGSHYRVIAVRPDWTDSRGLLGYYNPITESYVATEFLRLLLDAAEEEQRAETEGRVAYPYFAILDEMNLARVEHYFSDFLSALESGEAIELHHDLSVETGAGDHTTKVPRRLAVPRNVFFTGTVNVDETTYMFSPKVLDRAFTIEFNEVDLAGFGTPGGGGAGQEPPLQLERLPETLEQLEKPNTTDWIAFGALHGGELRQVVIELNDLLAPSNRHFGYRVANEIGRFVRLAAEQSDRTPEALWEALDLAVLQKVLPKFHGTQQELEPTLEALFAFATSRATDGGGGDGPRSTEWHLHRGRLVRVGDSEGAVPARLPYTAAKVWRMLDRVRKQGFTAYVE